MIFEWNFRDFKEFSVQYLNLKRDWCHKQSKDDTWHKRGKTLRQSNAYTCGTYSSLPHHRFCHMTCMIGPRNPHGMTMCCLTSTTRWKHWSMYNTCQDTSMVSPFKEPKVPHFFNVGLKESKAIIFQVVHPRCFNWQQQSELFNPWPHSIWLDWRGAVIALLSQWIRSLHMARYEVLDRDLTITTSLIVFLFKNSLDTWCILGTLDLDQSDWMVRIPLKVFFLN